MKAYKDLSKEELVTLKQDLQGKFEEIKSQGLSLDMSRGKPAPAQLDISNQLLNVIDSHSNFTASNGMDIRNYGVMDGIPEAKKLMGDMSNIPASNVILGGSSSLSLMFDSISRCMTHGVCGQLPWAKLDTVKFLCPAPGYDRHFSITQHFGIEMITIPMLPTGPDMDMVEALVAKDSSIKGIWCVPKYSNPEGISYSDDTVLRFASLKPAANDFRIFWDNAYSVHHLYKEEQDSLLNIYDAAVAAGNEDIFYQFTSTSKVTFPGSGISCVSASNANIADIKKHLQFQIISHDKINQLRHVEFFKDINGLYDHMMKHADNMRPKFEAVLNCLNEELGGLEIGSWIPPKGGYFISFTSLDGCAKAIVAKAKEAGLIMTGAGATYPYGIDPQDSNIRIAPTFPTPEELTIATQIFVLSVKLVSIEQYL